MAFGQFAQTGRLSFGKSAECSTAKLVKVGLAKTGLASEDAAFFKFSFSMIMSPFLLLERCLHLRICERNRKLGEHCRIHAAILEVITPVYRQLVAEYVFRDHQANRDRLKRRPPFDLQALCRVVDVSIGR